MARIRRAHRVRAVAVVVCAVAALAASSLSAPAANAGVLVGLTGTVEEVVSPVVQATSSVGQVGETVKTTAGAATAKVVPSPAKAPEAAPSPSVQRPGTLKKAMNQVTEAASSAAVAPPAAATTRTVEGVVDAAKEDVEASTATTLPPVSTTAAEPEGPDAGAARAADPTSAASPTDLERSRRNSYVPPPTTDGSTGAPLPRWFAYVWPAVALTGHDLATLGQSFSRVLAHLSTGASPVAGEAQGVAGVHASGGSPEAEGSSSSLFPRIPSAVTHAFSSVPTPALVYLGLIVLAVIAVGLAVRREIALGRRH